MKKVIFLIIVLLLAVVGWTQRATLVPFKDSVVAKMHGLLPGGSAPKSDSIPAIPSDSANPSAPAEAQTAPHTANGAAGTLFYLKEKVHFASNAGVRIIAAGTEVKKISEDQIKGLFTVDDGQGQFPVDFTKLTRDPRVATILRSSSPK